MLRLSLSIVLLLLSMLALFKAPTNFTWRLSVAVTEFPYVFILASLVLACSFYWGEKYKIVTILISCVSLLVFCVPVAGAFMRGSLLEKELERTFVYDQNRMRLKKSFSFFKMFSGVGVKEIKPVNLTYKKTPQKDLQIDFYSTETKTKAPCVIVIHGGSWAEGDSKQLPALNSYMANSGYQVAAINYRLAPVYKSPAPVEDTRDVIMYLKANAEKLHIDTNNFVLLGRSAGGQIALVAAYQFNDPCIRGVISFYAPADMVWGGQIKTNKLVLNTEKVFDDYLGGSFKEVPQKYYESSACEYVKETSPPTLLIHGKIDAMVAFEHSVRLKKKLNAAHVKNYFLDLSGSTHGCDYNINGPSGQLTTYAIERFINSVTSQ